MKNKSKTIFFIVIILLCNLSSNLYSQCYDSPTNITTPRGSSVSDAYLTCEMSIYWITYFNDYYAYHYPNATQLISSTRTFNCHGYAWHVSEGGNAVWVGYSTTSAEDIYWDDGSYNQVCESTCSKISYSGDHSAVPSGTADYYISKWRDGPLMHHRYDYTPGYGSPSTFYRRAVDVPQEYANIHDALNAAVPCQTVHVGSGSYSSSSVTVPSGVTLQLNSSVYWSISGSLTINGPMNGNGSNSVSIGSSISLTGSVYGVNFSGSGWSGINIQSTSGNLQYCSVSGASYGVNVYNGSAGTSNCNISSSGYGSNYSYYAYGDIGPSGVFSGNNWDVYGDNTSYPSPGGAYYGYLSFRNPGYYQVYSTYPGTLYACGNYWGDCNYGDPIVTGNISWSNRLCNDPNPLMKKDDHKEIGTISLSKKLENKDILPVLVKEPGIDKVDNARLLQIQGKYDEALSEFDNIINEYPDNFAGNISLVMAERCLEKLGRGGEILDKLNAASQKKNNKISVFAESRKGYQYMKKGKYGDAVDRFKFVLNTTQDSTLVKMSMFDLGNLYYKYLNDKPTGEKYYRNLIKLYPYDILSEMSLMALGEWKPKDKGKENKPVKETPVLASELEVSNYPNPFNPTTKIMYKIPSNTRVKISIYNALGQEVEKILDEQKEKGSYSVEWNPGKRPSGIYYYRIMTDKTSITNKMVYTK